MNKVWKKKLETSVPKLNFMFKITRLTDIDCGDSVELVIYDITKEEEKLILSDFTKYRKFIKLLDNNINMYEERSNPQDIHMLI